MKFAWENKYTGHHKVLFHIVWNDKASHYYLNSGAYDHEEEVLLCDGTAIQVISISEVKDENGKKLYTLISLEG